MRHKTETSVSEEASERITVEVKMQHLLYYHWL